MLERTRVRRRITPYLVIPTMAMWLVGAAACNRQPGLGQLATKSSGEAETSAHTWAQPDVPGRTEPCPREGGLEESGYPCEPTLGQKAEETQRVGAAQKAGEAKKAGEPEKAGQ